MKLPRDLSGADLAKGLSKVGYSVTRQTGSHIRLTTLSPTQHHVTVPARAGIDIVHINQAVQDLLGGQIQMLLTALLTPAFTSVSCCTAGKHCRLMRHGANGPSAPATG